MLQATSKTGTPWHGCRVGKTWRLQQEWVRRSPLTQEEGADYRKDGCGESFIGEDATLPSRTHRDHAHSLPCFARDSGLGFHAPA
jgi:hypothetical protein